MLEAHHPNIDRKNLVPLNILEVSNLNWGNAKGRPASLSKSNTLITPRFAHIHKIIDAEF